MTHGAHTPPIRARPDQSANRTDHPAGSEPAPAKPCQAPFPGRQIGPLEQAARRPGEFLRLGPSAAAEQQGLGLWGWRVERRIKGR
jgi:hypothetical protein